MTHFVLPKYPDSIQSTMQILPSNEERSDWKCGYDWILIPNPNLSRLSTKRAHCGVMFNTPSPPIHITAAYISGPLPEAQEDSNLEIERRFKLQ